MSGSSIDFGWVNGSNVYRQPCKTLSHGGSMISPPEVTSPLKQDIHFELNT